MDYRDCITIEPNKRGGKPCVHMRTRLTHHMLCFALLCIQTTTGYESGICAPAIKDGGSTSPKVTLRMKGSSGEKNRWTLQVKYSRFNQDKKTAFTVNVLYNTLSAAHDKITYKMTTENLSVEKDDFNFASKVFAGMKSEDGTWTYDRYGNLVGQQGVKAAFPNYRFPVQQVGVGSKWEGYETQNGRQWKIVYTVDQIIRYHGHDVAVINVNKISTPERKSKLWFDVMKGREIKAVVEREISTRSGKWLMRIEGFER